MQRLVTLFLILLRILVIDMYHPLIQDQRCLPSNYISANVDIDIFHTNNQMHITDLTTFASQFEETHSDVLKTR